MPQNANVPVPISVAHLTAEHSLSEGELRDVDISNLPGDTAVVSRHVTSNAVTLAHSLVVFGVGGVEGDDGIDPLVGGHGTAIILGALNSATPALSVTVAGAEGGDLFAIDRDVLSVVAAGVIKLIFTSVRLICVFLCPSGYLQCMVIFSPSTAFVPSV